MMAAADEPPPYAMVAGAVPAHTTAPGVASRVVAPTGALPPPALTVRDADPLRSWKFVTNEFQKRNLFFQIDNPRKLGTSEVKLCCNNHFVTVLAECLDWYMYHVRTCLCLSACQFQSGRYQRAYVIYRFICVFWWLFVIVEDASNSHVGSRFFLFLSNWSYLLLVLSAWMQLMSAHRVFRQSMQPDVSCLH